MPKFTIHYLADKPHFIEACAAWDYGRWEVQKPHHSFSKTHQQFKDGAQKDALPLTLVVLNENDLPVAMGNLWEQDDNQWSDMTPWIASLFVHYRYRDMGIGKMLLIRLEKEAKRLGYKKVYLTSGSAAGLYRKCSYTEIDSITTTATKAGTKTLFLKDL